ncbi:hypothetical protein DPV78_000202 [Talaromyces pinophilus]|nr:hypothetical protein DPV78_000202 [Talaromyces pinophilus]
MTGDFFEDCLSAGATSTLVTEFWTCVPTTLQHTTTNTRADVLSFNVILGWTVLRRTKWPRFTFGCLSLDGLAFARAAVLGAGMSSTTHCSLANAETLGRFDV